MTRDSVNKDIARILADYPLTVSSERDARTNAVLYTIVDRPSRKLFWLSFMRDVFAKRFASQSVVKRINNFDPEARVLVDKDYNLKLPPELENVLYYSSNAKIARFETPLTATVSLIVVVLALVFVLLHKIVSLRNERQRNAFRVESSNGGSVVSS